MSITNCIESMTQAMCEVLENMEYRYTREAVRKIIIKWADQKAPLFNLLSGNENFVPEKAYIVFPNDYNRAFSVADQRLFINWFDLESASIGDCIIPEEKTEDKMSYASYIPLKLYQFVEEFLVNYKNQFVDEEFLEYACSLTELADFRNGGKKLRIDVGQKTSRAVNKIMTYFGVNKHENYDKIYARYSDAINPLTYTRYTVISLNPVDYLLMSNGNNWTSCHNSDIGGYYKVGEKKTGHLHGSGTISYMLDDCTLIMYTVDSAYEGSDFEIQPKLNRCCLHYKDGVLIQSRIYPQDCDYQTDENTALYDGFRNTAQKVFADLLDKPNLWLKHKSNSIRDYVYKGSRATCYSDWNRSDITITITTLKNFAKENQDKMTIGSQPICIECGCYHDSKYELSCCHEWETGHHCTDCGSIHLRKDMHFIDGKYYCKECMATCDFTGELLPVKKLFTLPNGKKVAIEHGLKEKMIVPLWNRLYRNTYRAIEECILADGEGENAYIKAKNISDFFRCKECGKLFYDTHVTNHNGWMYCPDHDPDRVEEN